jgi:hypothetical protein
LGFEPSTEVQQVADRFAAEMVDLARDRFDRSLDFTISSIKDVDFIAEVLYRSKPRFASLRKGFADEMESYSNMLGFYVAETMRRAWGGEHGIVHLDGNRFYGLRFVDGGMCWPVGKAKKRLENGQEDDLTFYVTALGQKHAPAGDAPAISASWSDR